MKIVLYFMLMIVITRLKMNPANPVFGYIYIRCHPAFDVYNACKLGIATNIPERDTQYATCEIERGKFAHVYEILYTQMRIIEKLLHYEFSDLHVKYNGGIEFYNKKIIDHIEPYFQRYNIKYKKLTETEINTLTRCNRVRDTINKINIPAFIQALKTYVRSPLEQFIWTERPYQTDIIKYATETLLLTNKIYIELPTGGGKSYIVYNLFEKLKSEFIIIISPRKIVNHQNISQKYMQILTEYYITFNYSIPTSFSNIAGFLELPGNRKIIICCTQSVNKIYDALLENKLITGITVWFDEAHWGVEDWIDNMTRNNILRFWLQDTKYIKYRIFTSASPNKKIVTNNIDIFGQLYSPIKVNALIDSGWLCPIEPYIYSENKANIDNARHIINDFKEHNRIFGFSFHNSQQNAFNLFYKHYTLYKSAESTIKVKPFLLIGDDFTGVRDIRLDNVQIDYDYRNIKTFETMPYSIGYVVARYSMGYDFKKLDFICISDPKLSVQDIKQCIGRGLRPDEQGERGGNGTKKLILSLPVYIDETINSCKYDKVLEVLKYLLYDIEIPADNINYINRYVSTDNKAMTITPAEYSGTEDIKSILLNLLELDIRRVSLDITYNQARKIIAGYDGINSKADYYVLCDKDLRLTKDPEMIFKGQFTNWIDYLSIPRKYYDLRTCKTKTTEYMALHPGIKQNHLNLSAVIDELCKLDPLFPPCDLWSDYYNIKCIQDIIKITYTKQRTGVIL